MGILLSLMDNASAPLRVFANTLTQTGTTGVNAMQRLGAAMDRISAKMTAVGGASLALGEGLKHLAEKPIEAFVEMDSAMNDLAVSTLDKTGQIGASFDKLRQKVIEIDNRLPMTSAQVAEVGSSLKNAGVSVQQILEGGFDAASNLAVVLKMPGEEAGLMVARLREAYGLAGDELPKMADLIQRARFAFGITPEELRYATSYSAATVNTLGLTGLDQAQKLLALQGMGAGWSFQGSSFGTNFSMFLQRLSKGPEMIEMAKKGVKGQARVEMDKAGVKLNFFDSKGSFKGIDNMVAQIEDARNRLEKHGGDKAVLDVFSAVFGVEAGRVAELIGKYGQSGYHTIEARMADQASLEQRITQTMKSAQNIWTVFSTNVTNALAAFAGPAVEWLEPMVMRLGNLVATTRKWTEEHQTFAKWTMVVVGGLGLALTTFGSLLLTAGLFAKVASGPLMLLGRLGGASIGVVTGAFRGLAVVLPELVSGIISLGAAFLAIPGIGWIVAAVIGLAVVIRKYWTPIKAFVTGVWEGFSAGFAPVIAVVLPALKQLGTAALGFVRSLGPLAYVFAPIIIVFKAVVWVAKQIGEMFMWLLKPVNSTGTAAHSMGVRVGTAIASILQQVGRLYASFLSFPTKFLQLGTSIVDGLVNGISNRFAHARDTVVQLGENIKTWFSTTLGIHSPSRVLMGFGENIGQGTEIGILSRLGAVKGATARLSSSAIAGALAAVSKPSPANSAPTTSSSSAGAQAGLVVHYSPNIQVTGGPDVGNQVSTALRQSYAEFERNLNRWMAGNRRVGFGG